MKKIMNVLVIMVLVANSVGCGTILHPERKGQVDGRIDPSIAVLDGIGLLFFLIPGVIAFAVDFSNGTIYLPGTQGSLDMDGGVREIHFDGELGIEKLQDILNKETGKEVNLNEPAAFAMKAHSLKEAKMRVMVTKKTLDLLVVSR